MSPRYILSVFAIFSFVFVLQTGYGSAEDRPKLLYVKNLPKSRIATRNVEVWVAGRDPHNGALCLAWKFDIISKMEGRIPYKLVFYDENGQMLYEYEVRLDVERGCNKVQGKEWFYPKEHTTISMDGRRAVPGLDSSLHSAR